MTYYTYVYFDNHWQPYYVGKGQGRRMYCPKDHPVVPTKDHIQVFNFQTDWQAWECERELIAFWGRKMDGGLLLNRALGGPGITGYEFTDEQKTKLSESHSGSKKPWVSAINSNRASEDHPMYGRSGELNPFFGKTHSAESIEKIKKARSKQVIAPRSEETKAKMSAARKAWWAKKKLEASA